MTSATLDLARVMAGLALLLSFGVLAAGRLRPVLYAAQCGAIAVAALSQVAVAPTVVAAVLVAQAAWLWRPLHDAAYLPPATPLATAGVGVLLVVVATATAPPGATAALAIVLLGLLGAASASGPFGVLCLLNGAVLALLGVPDLPSVVLLTAGSAALAVLLAGGPAWSRLRR
jgi:hypothetical protein